MDVKTAGRTVDLFEIFATARKPLTLSEISRALNAPQSSCFNLVRALETRGYLYSVGGNKRVYPTRKLFDYANAITSFEPVIPRMEPLLESLRDETGETAILGTWQSTRVIYLAIAEGRQTIRYIARAGDLKPVHASAVGKALLLALPAEEREIVVRKLPMNKVTDTTITSADKLLEELATAERRGYTQTVGENVSDVAAVACPLKVDGVTYGVAIAGPIGRLVPALERLAGKIRGKLDNLEIALTS